MRYRVESIIEMAMRDYVNSLLLNDGAYKNIALDETDFDGNNISALSRDTSDNRYSAGQVWQSAFKNWVYETDVVPPSGVTSPVVCSGVFLNGTFYSNTIASGYGSHHIDFENGRIIFNTALPSSNTVKAVFSYKDISVRLPDTTMTKILQSEYKDNPEVSDTVIYPTIETVTLPAIYVETGNRWYTGLQLGGGKICYQRVYLHVLVKSLKDIKSISNLLEYKQNNSIILPNYNITPFGFDIYGDKTASYQNFSTLQSTYPWHTYYMETIATTPLIIDSKSYSRYRINIIGIVNMEEI